MQGKSLTGAGAFRPQLAVHLLNHHPGHGQGEAKPFLVVARTHDKERLEDMFKLLRGRALALILNANFRVTAGHVHFTGYIHTVAFGTETQRIIQTNGQYLLQFPLTGIDPQVR